ncbi:hypothetical protein G6F24_013164 [Rhizopus arrhizus]|nr:hypothetical protein G6F24_013164 [Rhizopus arrhizus]
MTRQTSHRRQQGTKYRTWLRQFEVAASSVGLNSVSRGIQVLKYLPDEASAWLMRTVDLTHWPTIVEKLASVYGVDPHVQKTICRRKLESLKQGTRRVAEYRMLFETVVADFPQGHELPDSVLRHIFFSNLRDELKAALLGIVAPEDTVTPKTVPMFCNSVFHCRWCYCCLHTICHVIPHLKATVA